MSSNRVPVGDRVTIIQRGAKKIWQADYHFDGKHCKKSLRTSNRKVAAQRARQLDVDLASGDFKEPRKPTLLDTAKKQFINDLKERGRAPKTLRKYEREVECFIRFAKQHRVTALQQVDVPLFNSYMEHRDTLE